ncbi:MAG: EpsG family protein [Cetobacterium sp.]
MSYFILYLLMLVFLFYSIYFPNKYILMNSVFVIYSFFFGLRYDVGIDYKAYFKIYNSDYRDLEKGYEVLQTLAKNFNSFYLLIFLTFFLSMLFIQLTFLEKESKIQFIVWFYFVFLISGLIFGYLNVIRQALASSIAYFSIYSLRKKRKVIGLLSMLLGTYFHKSLILVAPIYLLIKYIRITKLQAILSVLVFYILTISGLINKIIYFLFKITEFNYKSYNINTLDEIMQRTNSTIGLGVIIKIIIFIIIIKCLNDEEKIMGYYEKLYMIGIVFSIIGLKNFVLGRVGIYFDLFSVYLIAHFFSKYTKKYMFFKVLIFLLLSLTYFKIIIKPVEEEKIKYKSIFFIKSEN